MARKKGEGRETIVGQLLAVFFEHGFDGATLSIISEKTGLHRASMYHYFPGGKVEMAQAVLEYSDRWGEEFVRQVATDGSKPAVERLHGILHNLDEIHCHPDQLTPANAFVIGEARQHFRKHVQWHYHGLVWLMTELMVACGVPELVARRRAWEYRVLWEGGLVCSRVMGDMGLFRGLMRQMPAYLLSPPDTPGVLPQDWPIPSFAR